MTHVRASFARHNDLVSYLVILCFGFVAWSAFWSDPQPDAGPSLVVRELVYDGGRFHQTVQPNRPGAVMRGYWAASIVNDAGELVCSGGDYAPYEDKTEPLIMTPDQWTGSTCDLANGAFYVATAVWQWTDKNGNRQTISRTIEFQHEVAL